MKTQFRFLCFCLAMLCAGIASAAPLSGTLTVPSTQYPTLKDAIDSLNFYGVSGNVAVNVTAANAQTAPNGGYRLGSATLNSSLANSNTLTINGNNNTITAQVGTGSADGIFYLMGADYVTINGLSLVDPASNTSTTTRMEWGFVLCKLNTAAPYDGCQNDVINGCTIALNLNQTTGTGIYMAHIAAGSTSVLSTTGAVASDAHSYNLFTANTMTGITRGVYMVGISSSVNLYGKNNAIGGTTAASGNTMTLGGTSGTVYGVYTQYDSGIFIRNNSISLASGQSSTVYGTYLSSGTGNLVVDNNYYNLNCSITSSVYAIYNSAHNDGSTTALYSTHSYNKNTITGDNTATSSGSLYCIYENSAYCLNNRITGNRIVNMNWGQTTSSGASIYCIYTPTSYATYKNIDSNTIYNIKTLYSSSTIYCIYSPEYYTIGGYHQIQGNTIRSVTGTSTYYGIFAYGSYTANPNGPGNKFYVRNNVQDSVDMTTGNGGTDYPHYLYYGYDSSEIINNTISNFKGQNNGTPYFYNFLGYGGYATSLYKCNRNKILNISLNGGYVYNYIGYYSTQTDSNVINNFVHGNAGSTSGGMYNYVGFYGTGNQVTNNTLYKISTAGLGITNYLGYGGTSPYIANNTIKNVAINGSGALYNYVAYSNTSSAIAKFNRVDSMYIQSGSTFYPWYTYVYNGNWDMSNNIVTNLNCGSGNPVFYGFYLYGYTYSGVSNINFFNNIVSNITLPSTYSTSGSMGIYCYASYGPNNFNLYHNTVSINPGITGSTGYGFTGIGYYYSSTSTYAALDLRNNIINVNVIPNGGYTAALRRTTGTTGVSPVNFLGTSDANIYYAPNNNGTTITNSWLYAEGSSTSLVNTYNISNDPNFNTPCGLFKTFVGHDKASASENNLSAATTPGTYAPVGTSYAEKGAFPTPLNITYDFNNTTRGTVPDIGAVEFTGTPLDAAPPAITYTPLPAATYCTTPLSLTATITDNSGVRITKLNNTAPRLYFKKSTDANTFGANTSATNGWKWVEYTSISGSSFTFDFNYNLLQSTLAIGDSITYFVTAMDSSAGNYTGAYVAGFASCITSVNLSSTNGGSISNNPAPFGFKVQTTPTFCIATSPKAACGSGATTVFLSPNTNGASVQWQSASLTGSFANITGANGQNYASATLSSSTRYQAVITCPGNVALATTNIDTFIIGNPSISSTTGATRCGYGQVTLGAAAAAGSTIKWYASATGGSSIASGSSYTTPNITATTTYYVAGVVQNAGTESAGKTPAFYSNLASTYGIQFTTRNASTHFYSTTVYSSSNGIARFQLFNSSGTAMTVGCSGQCYVDCPVVASSGVSTPSVCQLNYLNLPAGQYTLLQIANAQGTYMGLNYEYYYPSFPYPYYSPSGNVSVDGGGYGYGSGCSLSYFYSYAYYYPFFYNNVFSGECVSPTRTAVVATVTPSTPIVVTSDKVPGMCLGDTVNICATSTNGNYAYATSATPAGTPIGGAAPGCSKFSPTVTSTYRVIASDPYTGCVATDTVRVFVNRKPSAPVITPVNPTICQKSQVNLKSTAPPGLSQTIQIGTGTSTSYYYNYPTPFSAYYPYNHEQYMILASEMTAAGQAAGNLSCIQFQLNTNSGVGTLQNYTVKIAGTTATSVSSVLVTAGLKTVYTPKSYTLTSTPGWVTLAFDSTYAWNGTDNLIIDINSGYSGCGTTCQCFSSASGSSIYYTNTSFTSCVTYYGYDCGVNAVSPNTSTLYVYYYGTSTSRPNMRLCGSIPADVNWLNITGLYKNTALTTAMTATDTNKSVYASPMTTQVYNTFANIQGCKSNLSPNDTVFVIPAPIVTITPGGLNNICARDSITFSIPSGSNQVYQWYYNGNLITGAIGTSIRVGQAGHYRVFAQNIVTGCSDTNGVDVVINPRPVITLAAGSTTTFCNGGNVVLTASATSPAVVSYQWYKNGQALTGATSSTYTVTTTGYYTAYGFTSFGCGDSSTNSIPVTVNTTPAVVTPNGPTTFCTGLSVTLQASTPPSGTTFTYQWYNNGSAMSGQTASSLVVNASGNYYVIVTNTTTGCSTTSSTTTVTVGAPPSSAITPSGNIGLCAGSSVTLTTNTSPGLVYQWYRNLTPIAASAGGNSSSIVVTTSGSYTVNVAVAGATTCNSTSATPTVVTVNALPTPTTTANPTNKTICQNDSVILSTNGSSGLSYQWNRNGGPIPSANAATYAAKVAGIYTVTQTINSTGCVATSTPGDTVIVNPLPAITITPATATTFCQGGSVVLNASPTSGLTYAWFKGNSAITPAATSSSYTANTTGLYYVLATDNVTGCKNMSAPAAVQVNPLPDVTTIPLDTANACLGSTTTMSVPAGPGLTYIWKNASNAVVATTNVFTTGVAGTYRATVTNTITGCSDVSRPVTVVINPLPTAVATLIGPATICQNDSTKMKVTTDIGTTFQWYNANVAIPRATDSIYYAKRAGAHYAKVTSAKGCSSISNSIIINVNPVPPAYITYNTALEFCAGSAVVLNANSGTNLTYQWLYYGTPGGTLTPNGNTGTYNITNQTGVYALKTTNQFGCSSISDTLNVLVHPAPIPVVTQSGTTLQTSVPYASYQWFYNNTPIGGATSGNYTFNQNGAYKVHVVDQYGCEGTSEQYFINNLGIAITPGGSGIRVYPNPTNGILNIDAKVQVKAVLRDVTGKAVIEAVNVKSLNLGDIAAGMYLLYISDMEGHLLKADKITKTAN